MKAILCSVVFLFSLTSISAQVKYGIRSKISVSTSTEGTIQLRNVAPAEIIDFKYVSNNVGYGAGAYIYGSNELLFFMTELLFQKSKTNFGLSSDINDLQRARSNREFNISKKSIAIPVAAGLKFKNFKFGVGPIFNFNVYQTDNLGDLESINVERDPFSSGFQFLVGYEFLDRIHFDLKREINFGRTSDGIAYRDEPIDLESSLGKMSLSVGLLF